MLIESIEHQLRHFAFEVITEVRNLQLFAGYPYSFHLLQTLGETIRKQGFSNLRQPENEGLFQRMIEVWSFQNQDNRACAAILYHEDEFGLYLLLYDVVHLEAR